VELISEYRIFLGEDGDEDEMKLKKKKITRKRKREEEQVLSEVSDDIVDSIVDKLKNHGDDLTEGFVVKYETDNLRALAQTLKRKLPSQKHRGNILLWHGTTLRRANSILRAGFMRERRVFFSSNIMYSYGIAEGKDSAHSEPAIFAAIYNLRTLEYGPEYQHDRHYIFRDDIASRHVRYLLTRGGLYYISEKHFPPISTSDADKPKSAPERKPPDIPRNLSQIVDTNWYAKMLKDGQKILAENVETEFCGKTRFLSRSEIQEMFYRYASGRRFRVATSDIHFRLKKPSDVPLLATHFESSEQNWGGFESTRAKYNLTDNTITACDITMVIDFSQSDYASAAELAQTLIGVLQKYEIFCYLKFNGDKELELVIPAEALPQQIDGQKTVFKMHQISSGLNRGFRKIQEVIENDCCLIIPPYGYTSPAYSLNPGTGLVCVVLMPEDLRDFSPEDAHPNSVSIKTSRNEVERRSGFSWLDVPEKAALQSQRFLKYVLSPNWQPM